MTPLLRVLIVKADRSHCSLWRQVVTAAIRNVEILEFQSVPRALDCMQQASVDVAVLGVHMDDIDGLDYIPRVCQERRARRVIVASARRDARTLAALKPLPVDSILDVRSGTFEELKYALVQVAEGHGYFSPAMLECLRAAEQERRACPLGRREEVMLSVFGAGLDNETAAQWVGISTDTARSHREHIRRNLGLQRTAELMLYAQAHVYVRVMPWGTLHPGFEQDLIRRYQCGAPSCFALEAIRRADTIAAAPAACNVPQHYEKRRIFRA